MKVSVTVMDPPLTLPSSTTDDIEVRICGDQSITDEDSPTALVKLYVQ